MINVTLSEMLLICLALGLLLVVLSWFFGATRVRRAEKRRLRGVVSCRICGVRYEAEEGAQSTCPACATPNDSEPPSLI